MLSSELLDYYYDEYPQIEEAFQAELDKSLKPRSRELRFDLVRELDLPANSVTLDVGCGEGRYAFELAQRFGFTVHGSDPVAAHIAICNDELAKQPVEIRDRVSFTQASITALADDNESIDFVWCYDVFEHIAELNEAFTECYRVLKPGGYMLVYSQFATDKLEPKEAKFIFDTMGFIATSANPRNLEAAYEKAGFKQTRMVELYGEQEEYNEENNASVGRHILHASRLLRDPEHYIKLFGETAYKIMLGDCFWHIYPMIGKFSPRLYILQK